MRLNAVVWASRSAIFYWRSSLAVIAAVAVAVAVLVGALVVGSSMRGSLKQLTLERLGRIDEVLISRGFFSESLADQISRQAARTGLPDRTAEPMIWFPHASLERAETGGQPARASGITLLGIRDSFWRLDSVPANVRPLGANEIVLNRAVANELGIDDESVAAGKAQIHLRFPKPSLLPADSSLGKKRDQVESLVRMTVAQIVENQGLGKFGLEPTQALARNVFVPLETLQSALAESALKSKPDLNQINAILLAGEGRGGANSDALTGRWTAVGSTQIPKPRTWDDASSGWEPSLEDLGLKLKRVMQKSPRDDSPLVDYFSLTTEQLVFDDRLALPLAQRFPKANFVLTYLVNEIRSLEASAEGNSIPYSMFSGIEVGAAIPLQSATTGQPIEALQDNQVVLNEWAANDLGVEPGAKIQIKFFEPESTHGQPTERLAELQVVAVTRLTRPVKPFQYRRGNLLQPAEFDVDPTPANDPDLTPEVTGLTDSDSIENWDLPFDTREKIRPADDDYWEYFRTTPKGFVNLTTARRLWGSRFGSQTGLRIEPTLTEAEIRQSVVQLWREQPELFGWSLLPVKRIGLLAAAGSTPFDGLFLGLSLLVIIAALILVALLFRLGLEQRAAQLGLFSGLGFAPGRTRGFWIREAGLLGGLGAGIGALAGIGYASLILWGLRTFWVGAISRPFLSLHVDGVAVVGGAFMGLLVCTATISVSIRRAQKTPVRQLLNGQMAQPRPATGNFRRGWVAIVLLLLAVGLSMSATRLGGDSQAGAFMGSGMLVLIACLWIVRNWLNGQDVNRKGNLSPFRLALLNARRNPRRTLLGLGLISVAAFLIVAISAFRLRPSEQSTGGIDWVAESTQPIFDDLNTDKGQTDLLGEPIRGDWQSYSFRVKPGQDASCNNLYQATQPRILGVPADWITRFDDSQEVRMAWASSLSTDPRGRMNPWHLLGPSERRSPNEPIPCVIDKNTALYSLKIFKVGGLYQVDYDSGENLTFRVVGFLDNSLLQGSLLISESDFVRAFPYLSGYRLFLIEAGADSVREVEGKLSREGFDARSSTSLLGQFMAVQNTYLSAFQALGGLGLLLGTIGLAAVQMRAIFERRRELAVMQALGFRLASLAGLLFREQCLILLGGLMIGGSAAACATIPHWLVGSASLPWLSLIVLFLLILGFGLGSGFWAARSILRLPLIGSLRAE